MQRTILRNLDQAHNGMMAMPTLWAEVSLDLHGSAYTEFRAAIAALEVKEQIIVIKGEDRLKVKITDAGRARLLEP